MTTQTAAKSRRLSRKPAKRPDAMAKRQGQSRPQLRDDFFPLGNVQSTGILLVYLVLTSANSSIYREPV